VRHRDGLKADFEAELAKFGGHVFGGGVGLRRTAGARSNVFGKVGELTVSVVVIQRSSFDGGELLQKERREVLQVGLRGLRRRRPGRDGLRLLGLVLSSG
jgi:hypothetical protein